MSDICVTRDPHHGCESTSAAGRCRSGRLLLVAAAVAGLCVLAACSSSTKNAAAGRSSGPASASSPAPMTGATLAATMRSATSSLSSAHVAITTTTAGQTVTAQGAEKIAQGKVTALDLAEQVSGMSLGVRVVGGQVYMKLPPDSGVPAGKPWVNLSSAGADPALSQLVSVIKSAQANAAVDGYASLADGATEVSSRGSATVDGVPTTRYAITIDVAKLPPSTPLIQVLKQAGITTLPADMWLDAQGRPVQVVENLTVQGKPVSTTISYSGFNSPVSITAPPADQISS